MSDYKNSDLVSRKHAKILKKDSYYYIIDEGSKNGTNLIKTNKRKINLKPFIEEKIMIGDIIEVYKIKILVN